VTSWQDKIVVFYVKEPGPTAQAGIALKDPRPQERDGVLFLSGSVPVHPSDWASGLEAGVRWSEVIHYVVFNSQREYDERITEAPPAWDSGRNRPPS